MQIHQDLAKRLNELNYKKLTPIQEKTIPLMLENKNIMAQAQTGTGKTAAFAIPIIQKVSLDKKNTQALVMAPTRELAIQVAEAFNSYGKNKKINATAIYGGQSYTTQKTALKKHPQIVVATPGRLVDMINQKVIDVSKINHFVLDEADEMLNMGFLEDVEYVMSLINKNAQIALFSATLPQKIKKIAKEYIRDPETIIIKPKESEKAQIIQQYILLKPTSKIDVLLRLLALKNNTGTIIFVKTKKGSLEITEKLQSKGFKADPINGDMDQKTREHVIEKLKSAKSDILVATDVAARGIDLERITHVINFDMPFDIDSYTHRIGRTGRGGRTGTATLLVTPREKSLLNLIQKRFENIELVSPPSPDEINTKKFTDLAEKVNNVISKSKHIENFEKWARQEFKQDSQHKVIAALSYLILQDQMFSEQKSSSYIPEAKPARNKTKSKFSKSSKSFNKDSKSNFSKGNKPSFKKFKKTKKT